MVLYVTILKLDLYGSQGPAFYLYYMSMALNVLYYAYIMGLWSSTRQNIYAVYCYHRHLRKKD